MSRLLATLAMLSAFQFGTWAGTLVGNVRDPNWFARRSTSDPYGVGYYEYGVNGNSAASNTTGVAAATGIFGEFSSSVAAGSYTVASWDVWWRSAFRFDVPVPLTGNSTNVDLRLKAAMWGYPTLWDNVGQYEFGQTFEATGPVVMIYVRSPYDTTYTLTVHENGPGGAQIGVTRTFSGVGDHRPVYGYAEMPTKAGQLYYVRIRSSTSRPPGVLRQMEPRPDFSDPMPAGCLWMGPAGNVRAYPERDLGLVIMCDDDGLITNLYTRKDRASGVNSTRIGQTFVARGVNLVSAAFWLADPAAPVYQVQLYSGEPGNALLPVGPPKRGRPPRVTADPEMIVTWTPGECPLVPGNKYYVEVTRVDGATVNVALVNTFNSFPYGDAYAGRSLLPGRDIVGTIMEEESEGSAKRPTIRATVEPTVAEIDRGTNSLVIRWATAQLSSSVVEIAENVPPYTRVIRSHAPTNSHLVTVTGLRSHMLHHFRVRSEAEGFRPYVSRDFVITTRAVGSNLLANPGFESGSGTSPRKPLVGWSQGGAVDLGMSSGNWFWSLKPRTGAWFLQGAVNGTTSDGYVYQRIPATAGKQYIFSCWLTTWPRENSTWKYDEWQRENRLVYMRIGIDPRGGTSPAASTIQWTPQTYSHLRYSPVAKTAIAESNFITVFVQMKGEGVEWHNYGVDDGVLTPLEPLPLQPARFTTLERGAAELTFQFEGSTGYLHDIQTSSDLQNWNTWTNIGPSDPFEFKLAPDQPFLFYRVLSR